MTICTSVHVLRSWMFGRGMKAPYWIGSLATYSCSLACLYSDVANWVAKFPYWSSSVKLCEKFLACFINCTFMGYYPGVSPKTVLSPTFLCPKFQTPSFVTNNTKYQRASSAEVHQRFCGPKFQIPAIRVLLYGPKFTRCLSARI